MTADLRLVRTMPAQKPGKSKQDYATPWAFIRALEARFGKIELDLAATKDNTKAPLYFTPEQDSLSIDWDKADVKLAYLNPPFNACDDFARKCAGAERLSILFLIPASVGSNWWANHVHEKGDHVLFLQSRIEFDGLPCSRRKGKVQICQHDETLHTGPHGHCKLCDCVGYKKDPYPKDCALVVYNRRDATNNVFAKTRYDCWNWRKS